MNSLPSLARRYLFVPLLCTLLMTGCSSSGGSQTPEAVDTTVELPQGNVPLSLVEASLELVADKTFRISWQSVAGAQFYRVMENSDGVSGFTQVGDDIDASTLTIDHRVALYFRTNAQYMVQACNVSGCAESSLLLVTGTLDDAVGYLKSSNSEGGIITRENGFPLASFGDDFGSSVSVSADGQTLAIGAPGEDSSATGVNGNQGDNSAEDSGAVYVFARIDGAWQQQAYLKASNTDQNDSFGGDFQMVNTAVSLSADGNTLAVGALNEKSIAIGINGNQDDNSAAELYGFGSGAVYVFTRSEGVWQQEAYVKPSNTRVIDEAVTDEGAQFGAAVSISADGNTLAVGAPNETSAAMGINGDQNDGSLQGAGAAYVFVRINGAWRQQAYLKASNAGRLDVFGKGISISSDGNTLAVGAPEEGSSATGINGNQESDDGTASDSGAVYVFIRSEGAWVQQAYVKASNAGRRDFFGSAAISLSGDGNTLAVGAMGEASNATGVNGDQSFNSDFPFARSGAVYIFLRSNGDWVQQAYLKASNTGGRDQFGTAVSLSEDGHTLAVGARGEYSSDNGINGDQNDDHYWFIGAAYVFSRNNGNWQQKSYLKATNNDKGSEKISILFGSALSLSADGKTLAIGANEETSGATGIDGNQNDRSAPGSGAVFLY